MQVPLELSFRNLRRDPHLVALVEEKVDKLEQVCDYLTSCRVAVERPQAHQDAGSSYRVRVNMQLPPGHEIVVSREPGQGQMHEPVETVIRRAFETARRRVTEIVERQRGEIKTHPEQQAQALVSQIYPDKGYGFIKTVDGREIYFHRNSVLNEEFDTLSIGTPVAFAEAQALEGPQATTVRVTQS